MAMPAVLTQNGTGSAIWIPDWMENPFSIGIAAVTGTTGVNGTAIVEYTLSNPNTVDVGGTATPTWFTVIALTGATATANFTTPCRAFRVSVVTATATSAWAVTFVQATFGR